MYVLPLEVVELMVELIITLLSFVMLLLSGPIQLIITELDSTPLTVNAIQLILWGLPTVAVSDGANIIVKLGTTEKYTIIIII